MKDILLLAVVGLSRVVFSTSLDTPEFGVKRKAEDTIPIIEIRGEGQPMTAAQIRHLEEVSNGGPLDIRIETVWKPAKCEHAVRRKDFVTFHYKCFTEDGKKVDQSYGKDPITMQLGVGMGMPGLDKGIAGMCNTELRKINIPFRLSRKGKSRVWKNVPNDEHWIAIQVELLDVKPYSHEHQFHFLDVNNDSSITGKDLVNWYGSMKRNFGKTWTNEDIDSELAANYYIKYFDITGDDSVSFDEFEKIMNRDEALMEKNHKKDIAKGRKRDPGFAWILDFNNDGVVTYEENDEAATLIEKGPKLLPTSAVTKEEL